MLILILVSAFSLTNGILESIKVRTYVQTRCLVEESYFEKCGIETPKTGVRQCWKPKWLIEYTDYGTNDKAIITDSEYWIKNNSNPDDGLRYRLEKYQSGKIYPCYHSPSHRSTRVQWIKPNRAACIRLIICGSASLLFSIGLTLACRRCICFNDRDLIYSHPNSRRLPGVAASVRREEREYTPLTPPSRYILPTIPAEEENIRLTPPPPYGSQRVSEEEGNDPLTPPPPYSSLIV